MTLGINRLDELEGPDYQAAISAVLERRGFSDIALVSDPSFGRT